MAVPRSFGLNETPNRTLARLALTVRDEVDPAQHPAVAAVVAEAFENIDYDALDPEMREAVRARSQG